jgi:hypothetical protein
MPQEDAMTQGFHSWDKQAIEYLEEFDAKFETSLTLSLTAFFVCIISQQ